MHVRSSCLMESGGGRRAANDPAATCSTRSLLFYPHGTVRPRKQLRAFVARDATATRLERFFVLGARPAFPRIIYSCSRRFHDEPDVIRVVMDRGACSTGRNAVYSYQGR